MGISAWLSIVVYAFNNHNLVFIHKEGKLYSFIR
jgi:hypothetical protein